MKRCHIAARHMLALAALLALNAQAQTAMQQTQQARTQTGQTQGAAIATSWTALDEHDRLLAQIWNLSDEEMRRAKVLLQGPRKSFSVANLSPVEALGIHARTDAERRKYAEMFARAFHQDVERSLAWNAAFTEAMARLYPGEPVIDHGGIQPVTAPLGAADAMHLPRTLVIEPASEGAANPPPASSRAAWPALLAPGASSAPAAPPAKGAAR